MWDSFGIGFGMLTVALACIAVLILGIAAITTAIRDKGDRDE